MVDKPTFRSRPEAAIQKRIIAFLRARGWFVRATHGNAYQKGFADLFAYHKVLDISRWIDCKNPKSYQYTKAQCQEWPKWEEGGVGIWIMFEGDEENYAKLFEPHNFWDYWRPAYDRYRDEIIDLIQDILEDEDEDFD